MQLNWQTAPRVLLLLVTVAAIAATLGVGVALVSALDSLCGERAAPPVPSPDGRYEAVVSDGDCGATTPFTGGVTLLDRAARPPVLFRRDVSVVTYRSRLSALSVTWRTARDLAIDFRDCVPVYSLRDAWHDVRIIVRSPCAAPSALAGQDAAQAERERGAR
jgi:hypothetical protein